MNIIQSNTALQLNNHAESVKKYISECLSKNTKLNYAVDWKIFVKWCADREIISLPATPETIAAFFSDHADQGYAPPTIVHRCAAIKKAHEFAGHESPTDHVLVKKTLKGIKRTVQHKPTKKAPATVERIEKMISYCDDSLIGLRDKALLLLGFAGAFRRSELVELKLSDIERTPEGIKVTIRHSKTDQEGKGQTIAILNGSRLRVVDNLMHWLKSARIEEGYLFPSIRKSGKIQKERLSHMSVVHIVKKYAQKSGFTISDFSGHSLRAGFLTSAAEAGASVFKMMDVSRHKDMQTVSVYVRSADMFEKHASESFA